MASLPPFHLAIPVDGIAAARGFYGGLLGCPEGRSAAEWVDFDLYGHQLVAHLDPSLRARRHHTNPVDGEDVPVPHFGIVLPWDAWHALAERLKRQNVPFIIAPTIRFKGKVGEQATMFFADPAGNVLEFKSFQAPAQLFAKA